MLESLGKCFIKGTSFTSFRFVSVFALGFVVLGMFSIMYAGSIKSTGEWMGGGGTGWDGLGGVEI